jgi:hypothetical protein
MGFLSSSRNMRAYYLDVATTVFFQILSNSSVILRSLNTPQNIGNATLCPVNLIHEVVGFLMLVKSVP